MSPHIYGWIRSPVEESQFITITTKAPFHIRSKMIWKTQWQGILIRSTSISICKRNAFLSHVPDLVLRLLFPLVYVPYVSWDVHNEILASTSNFHFWMTMRQFTMVLPQLWTTIFKNHFGSIFTYKHNWIINLTLTVEKSSYLLLLRLIRYFGFMWELKTLQCKKIAYQNSYVFWTIQFSTVMITCGLFALQIGALIPSPHYW